MISPELQRAIEQAGRSAGLNLQVLALRAGENRSGLYRKRDTTFQFLALLTEHDRDAAFGFAMAALLHGLAQAEARRATAATG